MKKHWEGAVVLALLSGCLVLLWGALNRIESCYPSLSLRWSQPFTAEQAQTLEEAPEGEEETQPSVTLWREENGTAETAFSQLEATAVRYRGNRGSIQQLTFLLGEEPGALEQETALVSEEFARSLWGSADVVGQRFLWEEEPVTVAAVVQGEEKLLWLPQAELEGFSCLELSGEVDTDPVAAAADFTALAGLEPYAGAAYGPEMGAALRVVSWFPLAACGIWSLLRLQALYPIQNRWLRKGLRWGAVFLLAALLPLAIGQLPGWLTPPQWSDFAFWNQLWQGAGERVTEWMSIPPLSKDIAAKRWLLQWGVGWIGSLFCLNWICLRLGEAAKKEK